jgi:hypothetical protein
LPKPSRLQDEVSPTPANASPRPTDRWDLELAPMNRRLWIAAWMLMAAVPAAVHAQATVTPTPPDFPRGSISGYMFGDLYYNAAGNPNHVYDANGNDLGQTNISGSPVITRDLNGAQLRRVYFQLDNDFSIKYSSRFRLEADSKSLTSDGKVGVAVKAAFLKIRNLYPRGDMYFGIIATPTFENAEEYWQYRSIEKTIADFRGLAPSADFGLEVKGFADGQHIVGYSAMVGNGGGQKPETNRSKRAYFALPLRWKDVHLEPYVDYENIFDAKDKATYKVFAGYDIPHGALGYEYVEQVTHRSVGVYGYAVGHSFFARYTARTTLAAFARVDLWATDQNTPNRVNQQLYIAGFDWSPFKDVHIEPNVESMQYVAKGTGVVPAHHDLQLRLTLFWKFTKPTS